MLLPDIISSKIFSVVYKRIRRCIFLIIFLLHFRDNHNSISFGSPATQQCITDEAVNETLLKVVKFTSPIVGFLFGRRQQLVPSKMITRPAPPRPSLCGGAFPEWRPLFTSSSQTVQGRRLFVSSISLTSSLSRPPVQFL